MKARTPGLLLGLLILASAARSGTVTRIFTFDPPVVAAAGDRVLVRLPGARSISDPGRPALPVYPAVFVLPPGERVVSVEARPLEEIPLTLPAPPTVSPAQRAPGHDGRMIASPAGAFLSPAGGEGPRAWGELVTEQTASGVRFAWVALHPCRMEGAATRLLFAGRVEVTIVTAPDEGPAGRSIRRGRLRSLPLAPDDLANPGDLRALLAADTLPAEYLSPSPCPYVIVTSASLAGAFEDLAALKERSGLRAEIVTTEWIDGNFQGSDMQERIRSFITAAWSDWQTEFVLLGGDEQIVPHRGMYAKAGTEIEPDIPCDLYYSCLDGNWNTDQDQYWGEPGEEDLLPEVSVGRLPATDPQQVRDLSAKLAAYSLSPPPGRCETALMLGELLWSIDGVDTWGGDSKDEIIAGSPDWGFETEALPPSISVETLYDRELGSWTAADMLAALAGGVNFVNHLGHSNLHMVMRLTGADLGLLDNGGMPFVCYSQGCYPASFDNRDDAGAYYEEDAIGELLVTGPGGAVAFIGNTRLGWSAPGSTCGVSQFFDLQFFDAAFGESIDRLGPAVDDSRIDNIAFLPYAGIRYVMFGLCLLGDPAMRLWTGEPRTPAVSHAETIEAGKTMFEVFAGDQGAPASGARVSLICDDPDLCFTEIADDAGIARLFADIAGADTVLLVVDARGCLPWSATIPVSLPAEEPPWIAILGIDDGSGGAGEGDGDGVIEGGETVGLELLVANPGGSAIEQAAIRIGTGDPWTACVSDSAVLGDLPPGSQTVCSGALALSVDP
ncbi:MAG: C25 family cysteine peptidase, partial [Candidatus Krumholzibacteria bacterium]|nr:C25 family cysteine peptidase [Candidatus Krumholzibacteria bacterium]